MNLLSFGIKMNCNTQTSVLTCQARICLGPYQEDFKKTLREMANLQFSLYLDISNVLKTPTDSLVDESFFDFLSELHSRMKVLIFSFNSLTHSEVDQKTCSPSNFVDRRDSFVYSTFQRSQVLCDYLVALQTNPQNSLKFSSVIGKSMIFYKQTGIVLRAYLRMYRAI